MHRKNTHRALKRTLISTIITLLFGATLGAHALANPLAPEVANIEPAMPFSNSAIQIFTVTFDEPVRDFTASDITLFGSSSGCITEPFLPEATVFEIRLSNCSDGNLALAVNTDSVHSLDGRPGPTSYAISTYVQINRIAPLITFGPAAQWAPDSFFVHMMSSNEMREPHASDFSLGDSQCQLSLMNFASTSVDLILMGCQRGVPITIKLGALAIQDLYSNFGPLAELQTLPITLPAEAVVPAPSSTSSPSATPEPVATPEPEPTVSVALGPEPVVAAPVVEPTAEPTPATEAVPTEAPTETPTEAPTASSTHRKATHNSAALIVPASQPTATPEPQIAQASQSEPEIELASSFVEPSNFDWRLAASWLVGLLAAGLAVVAIVAVKRRIAQRPGRLAFS